GNRSRFFPKNNCSLCVEPEKRYLPLIVKCGLISMMQALRGQRQYAIVSSSFPLVSHGVVYSFAIVLLGNLKTGITCKLICAQIPVWPFMHCSTVLEN
ncbi:MAG: hypothetical protein ABJC51_10540, partial [Acidobacteriota bacterium]